MKPLLLTRYDTETVDAKVMAGFLETAVRVHRQERIPATFFCTGAMLEARRAEFADFWCEVRNDPLFDLQNHSYSHIGVGYEGGQPVELLREDYERSFAVHAAIFGRPPLGVSLCGTGGRDGARLSGFDATAKAGQELEMLAALGVRMVNCFLSSRVENREFCHYGELGLPQLMGFPSGFSDTDWMLEKTPEWKWRLRQPFAAAVASVVGEIRRRGAAGIHMPIMHHDWAAWSLAPGRQLDHVKRFAEVARASGFELATHVDCLARGYLWRPEGGGWEGGRRQGLPSEPDLGAEGGAAAVGSRRQQSVAVDGSRQKSPNAQSAAADFGTASAPCTLHPAPSTLHAH